MNQLISSADEVGIHECDNMSGFICVVYKSFIIEFVHMFSVHFIINVILDSFFFPFTCEINRNKQTNFT